MTTGAGARRRLVVDRIADQLAAEHPGDRPLRVGVDGITAAGKTTWAGELAAAVGARGRPVLAVSLDGFHHPRVRRHRQGRTSPDGYYADAYNVEALRASLLDPLGPGGSDEVRVRVHDLAADQPVDEPPVRLAADAVLVVDGTFLLRPELAGGFDQVVYVDTSEAVARSRAMIRDAELFGGPAAVAEIYAERYHPACGLYAAAADPLARADVVIGNDDLDRPVLRRIGGPAGSELALFCYSSLQQPGVQQVTFGRRLAAEEDRLPGYRLVLGRLRITDPDVLVASGSERHPVVVPTGDVGEGVGGTVLTVTAEELAAADAYEVADYRRERVRLASGRTAWAYVAASASSR